ncbi:hypothetical protein ABEB36_000161 [Hypothenemus hampei]|uniref:Retrotransposon gag domain-containing protein n=1 Tax=Hypothenemus hampei TaxID=57062 RepID=A0ABD1FAX0_HYPHA
MGKSDIETFYEELANFKKRLGKDNKERCADSAVTERKQSALKCLVKNYNEKIRLGATTLDLRFFDEKIRFMIKDCADILRNRQQYTASAPELQDQGAGINLSTFIPSANSTGLSDSFTRRRSLTRSPSSSSATSEEDPLQTTIIPAEYNNVSVEEETDTTLTNKIIQAKPRQSRQQTHSQGSVTGKLIGTIIMEFANTTVGNARGQTIEPIRPQFIQPPSFRPAYHSPTAFLLGYERAACGNGWNDGLKISHLGSYLEGTAVRWYHNYLLDPANDTKTWDEVKRDFKNEFMEVQWGSLSNDLYYKQQGYTEDIGRYYYDLRNLADELNQNMPFEEFRAQFVKGLHPRFRPNYYMLREKEMSQAMLKNVVEKLSMWMGSFGGPYTPEPHCEPSDSRNATSAFRGYGRSSNTSHGYTGPSGNDTWKNNNGSSASRGFQRDNFNSTQRRNNGFRAVNSNQSNQNNSRPFVPNIRARNGRPQCKDCQGYGHYSCGNSNSGHSN